MPPKRKAVAKGKVTAVYLSDADKNKAEQNNAGKSTKNNKDTLKYNDTKMNLGNQGQKLKGKVEKSSKKPIAKLTSVTNVKQQQGKLQMGKQQPNGQAHPQQQQQQGRSNNGGLVMQPSKGDAMPQAGIFTQVVICVHIYHE